MRLIEKEYCYLIEDFFHPQIVAGFTKPILTGRLPADIMTALSFLNQKPDVAYLNQVHGAQTHLIESSGVYTGDGLFTKKNNLALIVRSADCMPIFFSSQNCVGMVHMGWRSAKEGVLNNTPGDLSKFKVAVGAGMRRCCYQVGCEFFDYPQFTEHISQKDDKAIFNPVSFIKDNLYPNGLSDNRFFDLKVCSKCSDKGLFSFRRNQTSSRILSFILRL
ncbi:MAG: polyphenol oxidase family protein [Candidatus Omnitrophica bacterium]|nr:polyphenol oxidase family protein [Candidatus Omnitrophota bacterium]